MDWLKIAKNYESYFLEKTRNLLKIPTVLEKFDPNNLEAPFGENIRKALDYMLTMAEIDGFKTKNVFNYAGHIEMGEGKEILGILGHLDVVPTGGKWTYGPFDATLKDGKIYARGSMDDKGPTMAAYIAMKMIKDQNIKLNKKVRLIVGCDEESGMRGITTYLQNEAMPDLGFAPDADFPLIYGEKGIYSFDINGSENDSILFSMTAGERYNVVPDKCVAVLKTDLSLAFNKYLQEHNYQGAVEDNVYTILGKNAHAAWPQAGVNAIFLMTDFLKDYTDSAFIKYIDKYLSFDYLGNKLRINHFDPEMKELTLNTAIVRYEEGNFKIGCNIRYPKGFDFVNQTIKIQKSADNFNFSYLQKNNSAPHYVSPKDPLVQTLHKAYIKYTNDIETPLLTIGGGTYARCLKKAVAFGPNLPKNEDLAHQPDECLIVADMLIAAAIYAEAIEKLASENQ
ncbi:MAG: dipeptidase PepV [Candidatus Izemoplasmatales bacterium]|jgi:succinyl-diaminopimelate desuccinylase|nr:dipeptidase PepV [Candidatus Izemoplasmatales bacterium]MDD3865882.1 dipeptidase PepV [Candidatus Izemoplasmatales bacterium]